MQCTGLVYALEGMHRYHIPLAELIANLLEATAHIEYMGLLTFTCSHTHTHTYTHTHTLTVLHAIGTPFSLGPSLNPSLDTHTMIVPACTGLCTPPRMR